MNDLQDDSSCPVRLKLDTGHTRKETKGKGKQADSRTLLEALAQAIDGTNEEEAV